MRGSVITPEQSEFLPLTLTLSPFAQKSATGRGVYAGRCSTAGARVTVRRPRLKA